MNLAELTLEIQNCLRDPTIEQSITGWLNQAVLELAAMYEFPALRLRTPATLITTTGDYIYNLSDASHPEGYVYMKRLFRVTSETFQQGLALESDPGWIDDTDYAHTETGDSIARIAVDGEQLVVFPLANDTLQLYFYRRPMDMEQPGDEPEAVPEAYHAKVLIPMVILKSFRVYPDFPEMVPGDNTKALILWQQRLNTGLYGDGTQIGMIPFLTKSQRVHTPRVRGPAMGSSLGGRW